MKEPILNIAKRLADRLIGAELPESCRVVIFVFRHRRDGIVESGWVGNEDEQSMRNQLRDWLEGDGVELTETVVH